MDFVGRDLELSLLDAVYRRRGAQFLILYGRRRVGKTRLITYWGGGLDEPYFCWVASQTSATNQLRDFSQTLFQFLNRSKRFTQITNIWHFLPASQSRYRDFSTGLNSRRTGGTQLL